MSISTEISQGISTLDAFVCPLSAQNNNGTYKAKCKSNDRIVCTWLPKERHTNNESAIHLPGPHLDHGLDDPGTSWPSARPRPRASERSVWRSWGLWTIRGTRFGTIWNRGLRAAPLPPWRVWVWIQAPSSPLPILWVLSLLWIRNSVPDTEVRESERKI